VDRAIHIVEAAIEKFGAPIYVRHEIVHNRFVVNTLKGLGAVFVEAVTEVPEGGTLVFSAHGVGVAVEEAAEKRKLRVIDATCPLVKKVHRNAKMHAQAGRHVILVGHAGHAEVEGTLGQLPKGEMSCVGSVGDVHALPQFESPVAFITQTTLSTEEAADIIAALREKFPHIQGPAKGDLCYATTNRQAAVREICKHIDALLVVGAGNSSNSNRLRELGEHLGVQSHLIADAEDLREEWFAGCRSVGISSGASAPEVLVQGVVEWLQKKLGAGQPETLPILQEKVRFPLPKELGAL
jgi:4-hydroxy-3-methylbut-2-enyl diphosphate reductase